MSRTHNYRRPDAVDSLDEDSESESDGDIDLQELDPATAHQNHGSLPRLDSTTRNTGVIPLRNLRAGRTQRARNHVGRLGADRSNPDGDEDLRELLQEDGDPRDSPGIVEDNIPLLNQESDGRARGSTKMRASASTQLRLPNFLSAAGMDSALENSPKAHGSGASRNISIGQYPPPRFPPNAVSNAKYTPWSFLPRTLYNEFSFFFNMYFLLVALSQIIPPLRIGYLSTYVAPLAFVLTITLGKEALDDISRRRRDNEANKEGYTVLRLRDTSQSSSKNMKGRELQPRTNPGRRSITSSQVTRLDAIAEEEDIIGDQNNDSHIEMDEITIKSRDLKVGDVLRLGKDQRVPADLVILKSYTTESVADAPSLLQASTTVENAHELNDDDKKLGSIDKFITETFTNPPTNPRSVMASETQDDLVRSAVAERVETAAAPSATGETFLRTDQLDGETDWKLRLASPLTQSLDPRSFTRLRIVAGKPDKKVNEFVGTVEYRSPGLDASDSQQNSITEALTKSAPLTIDNTAWANTVLASSATVLAVVVYTGAQTRQALSTSPSRSKTGLLEYEINNLTKILCALTLTLSVVLVALEGFENRENQKWYVAITRFLILFSTIIPISLRVNLDMGKTVYAWFVERDRDIPETVVRTSTIPEELGRIEYLLSDKTGTLTQNGEYKRFTNCTLADSYQKWSSRKSMSERCHTQMKLWKRSLRISNKASPLYLQMLPKPLLLSRLQRLITQHPWGLHLQQGQGER